MNFKHSIITIFALSLIASSIALAGNYHRGHGVGIPCGSITDLDSDQDGTISFDEYLDSYRKQPRSGFDMIDSNKDGKINADEWRAFLEVHGVKAK